MDAKPHILLSPLRTLARPFLAGLVAILPLALTLMVILWVAGFIQDLLGPESLLGRVLGSIGLALATSERIAYGIGLAVSLGLIYLLGILVEAGMKQRWQLFWNRLLHRLPLVGTIYDTSQQLLGMFSRREPSQLKSMRPVMCYFGGTGGTGVLALMPTPEVMQIHGHAYHAVLVPSAPVPFGGGLLYVPADWVRPVDFSVDGLLNVYVSMGATSPAYLHQASAPADQGRET